MYRLILCDEYLIFFFQQLYFSHFRIPPTITSIRIKKCPFVSIDHTTLEKLNIKLLHISQVDHLQIMANNLRIVDRLIVEHVHHLENIEAFVNIEADTVEFKHVTFPVKTELKPLAIKSDLKFAHCNLTDVTITVNQKTEDQSVIINHCSLDRVKMKINTADFNMTGNLFVDLQSTNPGLMDVEYSRSLTLRNNRFGKTAPTVMPDVKSSNQTLVFNVSSSGLSNDSSIWLNHFKFLFTGSKIVNGTTEKSLDNHNKKNHSACEEHNMAGSTSQKILACSTIRMLEDYFKSGQKSEKSKPSKPEQQTQPRMKVSSGVTTANQSLGAYLVTGIMIFHRVSSHF